MPESLEVALVAAGGRTPSAVPRLARALGQRDLVLLFVVAILNLNTVPVIAASGPVTVWMWLLALAFFFVPQGLAVIELSTRYPHEGGVYLWTKEVFGDFHGFISGWCYWTNNVFYIPTLVLYVVGISVFIGGAKMAALGNDTAYVSIMATLVLWLMTGVNVLGLRIGKWVNNVGGIGSAAAAVLLVALAVAVSRAHGIPLHARDFRVGGMQWHLVGTFGVICFSLVGLELASVMGDEIQEPRRTLPRAVVWGGLIAGSLYAAATIAVLLAMPAKEIGAVQGIVQAVGRMADRIGISWIVPPVALLLTIAIAGATSAWLAGAARIPFVAGLDHYLPAALGKLHPRYATPYVSLIVQGIASCAVLAMSFFGSTVQEGYRILLLLAVVLQLLPYIYVFIALIALALRHDFVVVRYRRPTLLFAGVAGTLVSAIGAVLAFIPPGGGESGWVFETKMIVGTLIFLGLAALLYHRAIRRGGGRAIEVAAPAARVAQG